HEAWPEDRVGDARGRDQPLGFALGGAERRLVFLRFAGDRDMDQANAAAAITDRQQQPFDKIAMHRAGVTAGAACSTPRQLTTMSISCSRSSRASAFDVIAITGSSRSRALFFCEAAKLRATPITAKPRSRRSSVRKRPIRPEAPSTKIFLERA